VNQQSSSVNQQAVVSTGSCRNVLKEMIKDRSRQRNRALNPMKRINPRSRPRIVVSVVCGSIIAAVVAFTTWTNPPGDSAEAIRQTEGLLDSVRSKAVNDGGAPRFIDGNVFFRRAAWRDVGRKADLLTPDNANRARAKAMIHFRRNPDRSNSYAWENRFELAMKPFRIIDTSGRLVRTLTFSSLALIASIILLWLFAVLVQLTWYYILEGVPLSWHFILERITELSETLSGS